MTLPQYRDNLGELFEDSTGKIAVEIGTHQAVFASAFMQHWNGFLHLVDPWEGYTPEHETFYPNFQPKTQNREQDYQIALAIMAPYRDRIEFHKTTSERACKLIYSPDLIYIDGLHDYQNVKEDIERWWNKLTPGGWLCGHDYHEDLPEVIQAVDEFVKQVELELHLTEDYMPTWMVQRP